MYTYKLKTLSIGETIYFITSSEFNSYQMYGMVFFYSEKMSYFSLVTDMIYIFTAVKQGFLGNFESGIFYQKVLSKIFVRNKATHVVTSTSNITV